MTSFAFTKMHGLGNDFVVINVAQQSVNITPGLIRRIAHRHTGVGCDQVLVISRTLEKNTFDYAIYNSDGSQAAHCGNGARAVARFVKDQGLTDAPDLAFHMGDRTIHTHYVDNDHISVDMGSVSIEAPFDLLFNHQTLSVTPVMLANPHAIMLGKLDEAELLAVGELLNHHPRFPQGVNVSVIHIDNPQSLQLNVYERGAGITLACGSAACAAVALALKLKRVTSPCTVHMPGGDCEVAWSKNDTLILTGPAVRVFEGVWHDNT